MICALLCPSIDSFPFAPEHPAAPWSLSCLCGAPAAQGQLSPLVAQQGELPGTGNVPVLPSLSPRGWLNSLCTIGADATQMP